MEPPKGKIIILLYHSISKGDLKIDIPHNKFEEQVKYLRDNYRIISYRKLIEILSKGNTINDNLAVITFDDGYLDYYETAFPILKKYSIPSMVFLVTSFLEGKFASFGKIKNKKFMSYKEVEELANEPLCEFGSHSHTHINLRVTPKKKIWEDLSKSFYTLKNILNYDNIDFAYPWGIVAKKNIVMSIFRSGAGGRDKIIKSPKSVNLYSIPRIPIKNEPFYKFKKRINGYYFAETFLRESKLFVTDLFKTIKFTKI